MEESPGEWITPPTSSPPTTCPLHPSRRGGGDLSAYNPPPHPCFVGRGPCPRTHLIMAATRSCSGFLWVCWSQDKENGFYEPRPPQTPLFGALISIPELLITSSRLLVITATFGLFTITLCSFSSESRNMAAMQHACCLMYLQYSCLIPTNMADVPLFQDFYKLNLFYLAPMRLLPSWSIRNRFFNYFHNI